MQEFSPEVLEIVKRPNSTQQERSLDLFFSKSPTSYAAGKVWLKRIAARKLDLEPEAKPQVAEAQLVALAKWGAIPATDRYGDLKKIKQRTLVVNGQGRHHGADHQFLHPSAAATECPVDPLPGFRARLALPVF
jgi:hypothetical protein